MSSQATRLSVVLPVRDSEDQIARRVEQVLDALVDLSKAMTEVVVVDDGSRDSTPEVLEELRTRYPQVRIARHNRPRGLEAAGQTGLERATGELVFIQETDAAVRIEDIQRLLKMSEDASVVAARAESTPRPLSDVLLRRIRAWGSKTHRQESPEPEPTAKSSIQMIRRSHLHTLTGPNAHRHRLEGETVYATLVEAPN